KVGEKFNIQLLTSNDLELILQLWCYHLLEEGVSSLHFEFNKAFSAMEKVTGEIEGGYALIGMVAKEGLFAFRDPQGIRPLVIGRKKMGDGYSYCICSETVAMNFLGHEYWRSVLPGEFIFIDSKGKIQSKIIQSQKKKASCMFEWVYFSGAEGVLEERSVYTTRLKLGQRLALKAQEALEKREIDPWVVAPVPDTSRTASIALAEKLNLPYREVFIKNRYSHRSFILDSQEKRQRTVELKLSPVCSEIEGKNIMLVDDSIVRGTTSRRIVSLLKEYGAREVTLAITCPPIAYPCYYGIDFPSAEELVAYGRSIEDINEKIGAKKIIYLDEDDLREAIGLDSLCMACLNGKYPTSIKEGGYFSKLRKRE
ncbi:MAG: amidophosphoribosyltransferase, partial [Halobacteriovoraceae bacterium]|nr:amidophosphoribosyltransferase [Halobacteriovoraceae bacterium]